jgi:2,4-dienoyl-CoA reductase (NADPH2)
MELANRIVMPAVHLNYTSEGFVTDRLIHFYVERAAGGVGLIIVGGCPVDEYAGPGLMLSLSDDRFIPGLQRLTQAVHQEGVPVAAQLYHAGRYSHSTLIGRQAIAPSAVESRFTRETPREMTQADIECTIGNFAQAARRAREAGFDAVEISGSAGYLICQFLSPLTNRRQNGYGGDWENRMRFALEVVGAVRETVGPNYPVIFRLAGNDFMAGGNTNQEGPGPGGSGSRRDQRHRRLARDPGAPTDHGRPAGRFFLSSPGCEAGGAHSRHLQQPLQRSSAG